MRTEVVSLVDLGPLPTEPTAAPDYLREFERRLKAITKPVTDDEAIALVSLFGPEDSLFGMTWSILHLVESAPGWPIESCLADESNEWISRLRLRWENSRLL